MNVKTLLCGCALVVVTSGSMLASEDGDDLRSKSCAVTSSMPEDVAPWKKDVRAKTTAIYDLLNKTANGLEALSGHYSAMQDALHDISEKHMTTPVVLGDAPRNFQAGLGSMRETLRQLLEQTDAIGKAMEDALSAHPASILIPPEKKKETEAVSSAPHALDDCLSPQPGEGGHKWDNVETIEDLLRSSALGDESVPPPPPPLF